MTTSPSLEDILERQSLKLRDLETATELIKSNTRLKCLSLYSYLISRWTLNSSQASCSSHRDSTVFTLAFLALTDKTEMKEELLQLRMEASSMADGVGAMRTWLQKTKEQNNRCRVSVPCILTFLE